MLCDYSHVPFITQKNKNKNKNKTNQELNQEK